MNLPLEREAILPRIDGIRKNIARLRLLGELPFSEFAHGDNFDLTQHHLRLALEGIFHIGSHVLSRLPGGRPAEYREIATKLGAAGIVSPEFAETNLAPMARLRNLLVHHYADIDAKEIYRIVHEHLLDIEAFLERIRYLFEHPEEWDLTVV